MTNTQDHGNRSQLHRFVDVYAGCGGLSLGLKLAGWCGLFAIEKDHNAFETLDHNFSTDNGFRSYDWPQKIERQPWDIEDLLTRKKSILENLSGSIELLVGGPPCQGFSYAGRRRWDDPRNKLVEAYVKLVSILRPKLVLVENVRGFASSFKSDSHGSRVNFAALLEERLGCEYDLVTSILRADEFGVPQARPRFFLVGALKELKCGGLLDRFFEDLRANTANFLERRGLPRKTNAKQALSDLEVKRNGTVVCSDTRGFEALGYKRPLTKFQRVMHQHCEGTPSDMRLARHREETTAKFEEFIAASRNEGGNNLTLSAETRRALGIKKAVTRVLHPDRPAPTITSLPDDLIHYCEPRTLTVRENARLQSFPDWFSFHGKYTTGGKLRAREVPRFTQVANAVPPLLAEQLGLQLKKMYNEVIENVC